MMLPFIKMFKWNGVIRTLLNHVNEADIAFCFDVEYPGKKEGRNPDLDDRADLYMYGKYVPTGSRCVQDQRSHWSVMTPSEIKKAINDYNKN